MQCDWKAACVVQTCQTSRTYDTCRMNTREESRDSFGCSGKSTVHPLKVVKSYYIITIDNYYTTYTIITLTFLGDFDEYIEVR